MTPYTPRLASRRASTPRIDVTVVEVRWPASESWERTSSEVKPETASVESIEVTARRAGSVSESGSMSRLGAVRNTKERSDCGAWSTGVKIWKERGSPGWVY